MSLQKYDKEVSIVIAIILICVMMGGAIFAGKYSEPDIHNATYKELVAIQGIGDIKAHRILSYLESNKEAEIDDLDDINGIGPTLIERLEKEFR